MKSFVLAAQWIVAGDAKPSVIHFALVSIVALASLMVPIEMCGWTTTSSAYAEPSSSESEPVKGPHGGRLLGDDDLAVEVTIFEQGVPPEYRVYAFEDDEPLDPNEIKLRIELARLGGRVDKFSFTKKDDYLLGDLVVEEPHSFGVTVIAEREGKTHHWTYPSYEGRVELTAAAIESSELVIETAGPATIESSVSVYGRVEPNGDRLASVAPRFAGVVKDVRKRLGDTVVADEVLAVVESNESLQRYEVRSPIAGTVIERVVVPGAFAREGDAIFTVADLTSVWIDFHVSLRESARVRVGQSVTVDAGDGSPPMEATVGYLSRIRDEEAQTVLARVELTNANGQWQPGSFVTGEITVEKIAVPLAVRAEALQTFRDWDVVFMNEGNLFEVRPLELGRRDSEWVEVLEGLAVGQRYAAQNTFILKADVAKSGATHDH